MRDVVVPLNKVAEEARKQLQDFLRFQPNPKMKMRKKKTAWKSLDSGSIKINYDGAMFEDINVAGIGVVVRNDRGEVLATMTERIPILESVLVLETLATRHAVQFAHEVGFLSFIFEGDSRTPRHPSMLFAIRLLCTLLLVTLLETFGLLLAFSKAFLSFIFVSKVTF